MIEGAPVPQRRKRIAHSRFFCHLKVLPQVFNLLMRFVEIGLQVIRLLAHLVVFRNQKTDCNPKLFWRSEFD